MSSKCAQCGKTVYKAEERLFDGNAYHALCLGQFKKDHAAQLNAKRNAEYERGADVQPAYYRVSDGANPARMETGKEYKKI
jgi:predicted  nucleic acid-binding Zn-ribbon protein